ncbi:MAG: transglycosylase SLT domain-containing protein, partial [Calditrichaeota bacterium]|nr:transglycosylase SLT domain-containing protein [Calditrichota bacterium]
MTTNRRFFLKSLGGVVALSWMDLRQLAAQELHGNAATDDAVRIIIPRSYVPPADLSENYFRKRLTRAILDFLEAHYRDKPMPVWHRRFGEVDLEKRVYNITYWLLRSVQEQRRIYPVDPIWVMAQMMKESYFYEFAVSSSLAVGICQFIQPTAEAYNMLCAGRRPDHGQPPYRQYHLAGKVAEYYQLRDEQRSYRRNNRPAKRFSLEETLQIIRSGNADQYREA